MFFIYVCLLKQPFSCGSRVLVLLLCWFLGSVCFWCFLHCLFSSRFLCWFLYGGLCWFLFSSGAFLSCCFLGVLFFLGFLAAAFLGAAFFGVLGIFAFGFFTCSFFPTLKDPHASVPFGCTSAPLVTLLLNAI